MNFVYCSMAKQNGLRFFVLLFNIIKQKIVSGKSHVSLSLPAFAYKKLLCLMSFARRSPNFIFLRTSEAGGCEGESQKKFYGTCEPQRRAKCIVVEKVFVDRPYINSKGEFMDFSHLPDWMKQSIISVQITCERMLREKQLAAPE